MSGPLVVVGLRAEARIAAAAGVRILVGGGDCFRLAKALDASLREGATGVISFGLAGGLAPHLPPGSTVIARSVITEQETFTADTSWSDRLAAALPGAVNADMAGVDRPVYRADAKRDMHSRTGAVATDMESHVAARAAARHGLPFASIRVVADASDCDLPPAALIAMKPQGNIDYPAVIQSFLRHPGQAPVIIRLTVNTALALHRLYAARRKIDAFFNHQRSV